jgi:hypothetical protein
MQSSTVTRAMEAPQKRSAMKGLQGSYTANTGKARQSILPGR